MPKNSPLLADQVIERDYSRGPEPAAPGGEPSPGTGPPSGEEPAPPSPGEDTAGQEDTTREFTFEDRPPGTGEAGEPRKPLTDEPGAGPRVTEDKDEFKVPTASAKSMAAFASDIVGIYVPKFTYEGLKVDINNARMHERRGNLLSHHLDAFINLNAEIKEGVKFDPEELKMLERATEDYIKYKNFEVANPETRFWATLGVLAVSHTRKFITLKRMVQTFINNCVKEANPKLFEDYREAQDVKDQTRRKAGGQGTAEKVTDDSNSKVKNHAEA